MTNKIHNPHDKFFKRSMTDIRVARDFFETHLPQSLRESANLDKLKLEKESFVKKTYQHSAADLVYSVELRGQEQRRGYFYLLCEHQSKPDKMMAFRLLQYAVELMDLHYKKHPKSKLPLVYPMVIYAGQPKWGAPRHIFECIDAPSELCEEIWLSPYQLIDICRIDDDALKKQIWSGLMGFALKYRKVQDFAVFLDNLLPWLETISIQDGDDFVKIIFRYVTRDADTQGKEIFLNKAESFKSKRIGDEAMTIADEFRQEGREQGLQEGLQEGLQQGVEQGRSELVTKMLSSGLPLEKVAEITDMSVDVLSRFAPVNVEA